MVCRGDITSNWEFFKQQWQDYEVATGLDQKSQSIRLATFRSVMGKECLQIFLNLNFGTEVLTITSALKALENYFLPKRNVVYERYVFNSCIQVPEETVDCYVNRLRKLAASCQFGALAEEMIRDRLVIGIQDKGTKARLLREKDLSLDKALDMCKSSEITNKQLKSIQKDEKQNNEELNLVHVKRKPMQGKMPSHPKKPPNPKKPDKKWKCKYCGQQKKHAKQTECPAYGQQCRNCKRMNHFAKVCQAGKEKVHVAEVAEGFESEESLLKIEEITAINGSGKQLTSSITFVIEEQYKEQLVCQLDTGATCNVISHRNLVQLLQNGDPPLSKSNAQLKLFDGSLMKPVGETTLTAERRGKRLDLRFQVVESSNKPLLSAEACEQLGLLKVDIDPEESIHVLKSSSNLTRDQILVQYKDVFEGLGHIGDTTIITDPSVKPVQHSPRRVPVPLRDKVKAKLDDLERKGIVEKVTVPTDWISSMVVVATPNKIRICLDPKDLNKAVIRPKYQMPTLDELLPKLSNAKVFSTLDAKDGFYQVGLDESSSLKTTFWTPFGRYKYLRLPFGINLAPEEFECKLHEKLDSLPGVEVIRDDILVMGYGENDEEANRNHDENLIRLLEQARKANLRLNSSKLNLKKSEVRFMGHLITKDGLQPDPEKVKAVQEMPRPTSKKELLSLLGFVNYLAKFLPRLSEVAQPLREMTAKDAKFIWSQHHETAFQEVRELVVKHPVLKYYDLQEEVTVQCDASEYGLGAALLQNGQPVAFASRSLSQTERQYAQIEKECLAIVFSCERFSQYLAGRKKITVESDHKPLQSIFQKSILSAPCRLQRMMLRLQRFNLEVKYKPGAQMYVADHLSRASLAVKKEMTDNFQVFALELETLTPFDSIKVAPERLTQLQKCTAQDLVLESLKTTVLTGWPERREQCPVQVRDYWNYREEISLHNGILFKSQRVIVPKAMRPEMLSRIHSSHQGVASCLRKAKDIVFWPGMNSEVKALVERCAVCAEFQARNASQPMQSHQLPDRPWSKVATDLFTVSGKNYLTVVDYYSDFVEVSELEDTTSRAVIQVLKEQFSRHGIPDTVVSDNGPQYSSQEFHEFSLSWEFNHVTSSPHYPKSNGKAESSVKTVKLLFKKADRDGKDPWLSLLDYRNTPTEGIGDSPAQRLMSRRTRTLLPTASSLLRPKVSAHSTEKLERKRQKAKFYHDRHVKQLPELEIGQEVRSAPLRKNQTWKPAICVEKLSDRSYVVQAGSETLRRNRQFLRPAAESSTPDKQSTKVSSHESGVNHKEIPRVPELPAIPTRPDKDSLNETVAEETNVPLLAPQKTRTRTVRPPSRFKDFDMKR